MCFLVTGRVFVGGRIQDQGISCHTKGSAGSQKGVLELKANRVEPHTPTAAHPLLASATALMLYAHAGQCRSYMGNVHTNTRP